MGLPVVHMDQLFWEPGWTMAPEELFLSRVRAAIDADEWVMDGNYSRTWPDRLARADTVIFLDLSTPRRLWRVIRRIAKSYGRVRFDMAKGCPEHLDFDFLTKWVAQYHRRSRPSALGLMTPDGPAAGLTQIHLHGPRAVHRFLANCSPRPAPIPNVAR